MPAVNTLRSNTHQGKFDVTCVIVPVSDGGKIVLTNKVSTGTDNDSKIPKPTAISADFQDNGFQPMVSSGRFSTAFVNPSTAKASPQNMPKPTRTKIGSATLGWIIIGLMNNTKTVGRTRDKPNPRIVFFIAIFFYIYHSRQGHPTTPGRHKPMPALAGRR